MSRLPPLRASVATSLEGGKMHAPAAARNATHLVEFQTQHTPDRGKALEIASGTGQHICAFAEARPDVNWIPTDVDPARLKSIDAYVRDAKLENVAPATYLDATQPGWAEKHAGLDLIVLVNLLHLISMSEVKSLIEEAAKALVPDGLVLLYGPFKRDGVLTSVGDADFDASLRASDPAIGYKDTRDMTALIADAGLTSVGRFDMPANNLILLCRKEPQ